ncbi:MAG TPA: NifU N-terminal domain-containing protein [Pararhizobium sp.]|nr:NifU N-terminal domain-containing protein [Pararhizobium sp.]
MFIQTEPLPNPAELKFLPGQAVLPDGVLEFKGGSDSVRSPLVRRLLDVPGISGVRLGADFITVIKEKGDWQHLKPAILGAIMEHFMSGAPVIAAVAASRVTADEDGLAASVREALHRLIDPELGYNVVDLGLIYDIAVEEGSAIRVTMTTTTPGCPATDYLVRGAHDGALTVDGVESADVTLTHDPRWTPEMMSDRAKAHFGIRDGGGW